MELLNKIESVIERIRTPLALAGLVIIVLYALYKQVLEMDIFSNVGSDRTFMLVDRILLYLFILAAISAILGGIGYILSIRRSKKSK